MRMRGGAPDFRPPRPPGSPGRVPLLAEVAAARHGALGLAAVLPLAQRLPLVVLALALGDGDLDLGPAVLEVDLERDEGVAALLHPVADLEDLLLVEEQLPLPPRRVVRPGAGEVLRDVHRVEPGLAAVVDEGVAIDER